MLIQCPECGGKLSDKALSCPHCGFPMQKQTQAEIKPKKKRMKLPNGTGTVRKLSGTRRKPYAAYPPCKEYKDNGSPVLQKAIGYYATYNEALEALFDYNKKPYNTDFKRLSFKEVYNMYIHDKYETGSSTLSKSTRDSEKTAFNLCKELWDMTFFNIRKADMQDMIDSMDKSYSTKAMLIKLWHGMYKYALQEDIVDKDYSSFVSAGTKDYSIKGEPFTEENVKAIIKLAESGNIDAQMVVIMIYSGFRIKEYESIEIDLEEMTFKGGIKTTASKGRIVPIHKDIQKFVTNIDWEHFTAKNFRDKHFYKVLNACGITESNGRKLTPHSCRHTFSWLCDTYEVEKFSKAMMMGHSLGKNVEEQVYGHRTIEQLRDEVNRIAYYSVSNK